MEPGLSSVASLGVYLATRMTPAAHGRAVRDRERLVEAIERGALVIDDTVRIAGVTTTAGRHLVAACLPPSFRGVTETPWDAVRGAREIARIVRELHVEIAGRCVEALEVLGRYVAERSGLSLALDDFLLPAAARESIEDAHGEWVHWEARFHDGLITDGERFNRHCDTWASATFAARSHARRHAPEPDPLAACAASQREPVAPEVVRSPRCAISVPFGEGLVAHLTGTLGEGIGAHEYFVRGVEARHTALTVATREQLALEMLADLDAVIGDIEIVALDCEARQGVTVRAIEYEEDHLGSLATKLVGSVTAEDVRDRSGAVIAPAGTLLVAELARRIEAANIASVVLRDVRTCEAVGGVCARCFGLAPEDSLWPCIGDAVGARAAARIALEASRLPPRRIYHIC